MAYNIHMSQFLASIGTNLQNIVEHGGYAFLFIITILEGLPVIGQFVPGHTIVLISGFLSKLGVLKLSIVIPVVVISAMVGDAIGYFMGKKFGFPLLTRFGSVFFLKPEYIEKATKLVSEHPAKTIILGRFSPLTRPLSPFIVGASGTHNKLFWVYDFIAVLLWAIPSIAIGYIFGASYDVVAPLFGKFIFIAIIMGILIIWGYRFVNKNFHIFARYELITLSLNLAGLYLFFKTIQDAITDKVSLLELDLYVNNLFSTKTYDWGVTFMKIVTDAISPTSIAVVSMFVIIYYIYKKNYYNLSIILLSTIGGYVITYTVKNLVERVRPESLFIVETGYSFPSGHASIATIFFILFIYLFVIKIKSLLWRELWITVSVLMLMSTSFSRIYLGVHWVSDVLAGIGLGLFWTTLMILLVKYLSWIYKNINEKLDKTI
jgi:membrane protein DedA with SNARE-associated domain